MGSPGTCPKRGQEQNPQITTFHMKSDGPVAQYRNKKNTQPYIYEFKQITWKFSEKGYGKGAPDGMGGAVTHCTDKHMQQGRMCRFPRSYSNYSKSGSSIKLFWITDVTKHKEAVPNNFSGVKGTTKLHQVTSTVSGKIKH
jgi:hypothetical protein